MSAVSEEEGKWTQTKVWLQYPKAVDSFVKILVAAVSFVQCKLLQSYVDEKYSILCISSSCGISVS
jgi:hypothetical protein